MALYGYGVNLTKITGSDADHGTIDPGLIGGKVRCMQDYFTFPAATTMTSNEYILIGQQLPTGSQVVEIVLSNGGVGLGTDSYLCIGDEGDEDRYMTKVQSTTATVKIYPNIAGGVYYTVTGKTDNIIRVAGDATSTDCINSGGTIKVSVFYVVE